ncbi:MAG: L,D-transpeptidase family protein [Phycisphaerales bacterium]|nr:MAG: L,D-transpeptidase family protein [Phycisphaerales bacterium]
MARSSYSARSRRRRRTHSMYLAGAIVVFAAVVFLLFRGGGSVSGEDAVDAGAVETASLGEPVRETPRMAAEVNAPRQTAPASQERFSQALPQGPSQQAAAAPVRPPETAPPAQTLPAAPVAAAPEPQGSAEVDRAMAEARALLNSRPRQVVAARDKFNKTLSMEMSPTQRRAVKAEMAKLAEEWLFGPSAYAGDTLCETYKVRPGDLLQVIGRKHKVPYEILMKINNIPRPESLQAGKAIKVINGPFHAKVSRSTFTLDLYLQDTYVRSFKVGLGRPGHETPTGVWRVQEGGKLIAPTWTDPDSGRVYRASDPDYPLGSRWIALDGILGNAKGRTGFAIHGTKEPEQIGSAGSRGCIRMYNGEAILVYNMLFPLYSKVEVLD